MSEGSASELSWRRLRDSGPGVRSDLGVAAIALDVTTPAGPVWLALGDDGAARILIPISSGADFPSIGESRGLALKDSVLNARGRLLRFVDLSCREAALEESFSRFGDEIFRRLGEGETVARAVEGAVRDFRRLLLRSPSDISLEEALGLCGELVVLNQLLEVNPHGWQAWRGPLGARHDFRAAELAMEVKAALRGARQTFTVSALDQLLAPEGGRLVLTRLSFEEDPAGAIDVPRLAERAIAGADDPDALIGLLEAAGYAAEQRAWWERWRFSLHSAESYRVEEGFPRIVPASFVAGQAPAGVSRIRYEVDLSGAGRFRMVPSEQAEWLVMMCARIADADARV